MKIYYTLIISTILISFSPAQATGNSKRQRISSSPSDALLPPTSPRLGDQVPAPTFDTTAIAPIDPVLAQALATSMMPREYFSHIPTLPPPSSSSGMSSSSSSRSPFRHESSASAALPVEAPPSTLVARRPPAARIRVVVRAATGLLRLPSELLGLATTFLSYRDHAAVAATNREGREIVNFERSINAIPSAPQYIPLFGSPNILVTTISLGSMLYLSAPDEGLVFELNTSSNQVAHIYGPYSGGQMATPKRLREGIVFPFYTGEGFFIDPSTRHESVISHRLTQLPPEPEVMQIGDMRYSLITNDLSDISMSVANVNTGTATRISIFRSERYSLQTTTPVLANSFIYFVGTIFDDRRLRRPVLRHVLYEFDTRTGGVRRLNLEGRGHKHSYIPCLYVGSRMIYTSVYPANDFLAVDRTTWTQQSLPYDGFKNTVILRVGNVFAISGDRSDLGDTRNVHELWIWDGKRRPSILKMRHSALKLVQAGSFVYAIHRDGVTAFHLKLFE